MARIFHKAGARKRPRSCEWRGSEEAARMAIIIVSLGFFSALAAANERASARARCSRNNKQFVLGKAHCVHSAVMYRISSMYKCANDMGSSHMAISLS